MVLCFEIWLMGLLVSGTFKCANGKRFFLW